MKKYLLVFFFLVFVLFTTVSRVFANEGRFVLQNNTVICEGLSVWKQNRYEVLGRCNGLVYPYDKKLDNYVLWVQPDEEGEEPDKIGNIKLGVFEGDTRTNFTRIFITAEESSSPSTPGAILIAAGPIELFDFTPVIQGEERVIPTKIPTREESIEDERLDMVVSDVSDVSSEEGFLSGDDAEITPTSGPTDVSIFQQVKEKSGNKLLPIIIVIVFVVFVIGAVFSFRR